ncbi:DUF4232 domain-containing protein [Streptomyces sp. NPDC002067]
MSRMSHLPHAESAQRTRRTGGASGPATSRTGFRRTGLRLAAAGLVAVAGLTLTACGQSENRLKTSDGQPFDAAPQDHLDSAAPGKNGGVRADGGTGGAAGKESTAGKSGADDARPDSDRTGNAPGTGGPTAPTGDPAEHTACDPSDVSIAVSPLNRPVNHLLLEAKNTSGTSCDLYSYPFLQFDQAQAPLAPLEDSKPQAVVTLAPGESGYAGIMTSSGDGNGTNGHTRTSLNVSLADRDGQGGSGSAPVALPGGSAYLDDSAWVTYWQADLSTATTW